MKKLIATLILLAPLTSFAAFDPGHGVTDNFGRIVRYIPREVWDAHMTWVRTRVPLYFIPRGVGECPSWFPMNCVVYR